MRLVLGEGEETQLIPNLLPKIIDSILLLDI